MPNLVFLTIEASVDTSLIESGVVRKRRLRLQKSPVQQQAPDEPVELT